MTSCSRRVDAGTSSVSASTRGLLVAGALITGLVLSGCGGDADAAGPAPAPTSASASATASPTDTADSSSLAPASSPSGSIGVRDAALVSADKAEAAAQEPISVTVPRLKAELPVRPVGVDPRGAMALPEDPAVAGWYQFGRLPLDDEGATVIAAHVDSREYGIGPLAELERVKPGDEVRVKTGEGDLTYRVISTTRLNKDEVNLDELFSRTGQPRLHLITCGGEFDRVTRSYEDNVVVVAERG